ncbi:GlsB/YeaQ/YmgE family stress response membrane protein [Novosphingobium bradum]|uniref:GlsB/YeaQ/YmgE family stress response membrane protein n=1 Tax=Novosphingobium bradum TaxID=1737444 RepID=A0ABV7IQD6_9SPHN
MFNLIGAIVSGLVIGALARLFYPGPVPAGWIMTVLLGVGGSLLANFVIRMRDPAGYDAGFNRAGCLASVLGAMVLIFLGRHFGWH